MSLIDCSLEVSRVKKIADGLIDIISDGYKSPVDYEYCRPYCFETPIEMISDLNDFWDRINRPQMKEFTREITMDAFKQKDIYSDKEIIVQNYNYEF